MFKVPVCYRFQVTSFRLSQVTGTGFQNQVTSIKYPRLTDAVGQAVSSIQHQVSSIQHQVSSLKSKFAANLFYPLFNTFVG